MKNDWSWMLLVEIGLSPPLIDHLEKRWSISCDVPYPSHCIMSLSYDRRCQDQEDKVEGAALVVR